MKKFELDKGYEEVDIGGDIYKVDLSDEKRKQYKLEGERLQEKAKQFDSLPDDISEERMDEVLEELRGVTKELTENILGEGSFDVLYEKTNGSMFIVIDVIFDVIAYVNEKEQEKFTQKKEKYTKHKKKR